MDGTCSTYGGRERCTQELGGETLGKATTWETHDGRIILKWIFKKWDGGMDWIELAKDRDRWRTVVNVVMNLRVLQNSGNFLTS
jgi:hypothetical protein